MNFAELSAIGHLIKVAVKKSDQPDPEVIRESLARAAVSESSKKFKRVRCPNGRVWTYG